MTTPSDNNPKMPTPPARIAIPDGKGGYIYEELEMFDLRQPKVLPSETGWRSGVTGAPDQTPLKQPTPGGKKS
jgi:hypothetical protein